MEIKVNLNIKNERISQAQISFKKEWKNLLKMYESDEISFEYDEIKNKNLIIIKKADDETYYQITSKKEIKIKETKKITKYFNKKGVEFYKLSFPALFLPTLEKLNLKKNFSLKVIEKKGEINLMLKEEKEKNATIILFKINKGGVGKSFLTAQIGHGLALLKKKVLIITSDSQNNILSYLNTGNIIVKNGIIKEVVENKGEYIKLRENLEFLPLESNRFGNKFIEKFDDWISNKRKEYDYILIDSVPTMKIDSKFVKISDKIVIPAFCDEATVNGIINMLDDKDIDIQKVVAIIINKYKNWEVQKKYKNFLEETLKNTDIFLPNEIPELSFIQKMLDNKKSIWEYSNSQAKGVQEILLDLIALI